MIIRTEDLIGTYEQKRALVAQFNLMDDTFCSVVLEDKAACEYLLSVLFNKPIRVIENERSTQYATWKTIQLFLTLLSRTRSIMYTTLKFKPRMKRIANAE